MDDPLFEELEPPPGGLTRLCAQIAAEQRRPLRWPAFALAASAAAALVLWVVPRPQQPARPALGDSPALVSFGWVAAGPDGVVGLSGTAVTRAGGDDEVQIYWISDPGAGAR